MDGGADFRMKLKKQFKLYWKAVALQLRASNLLKKIEYICNDCKCFPCECESNHYIKIGELVRE